MNVLDRNVSRRFGLLATAGLLLAAMAQSPAAAAGPVPSLDIVPADAAFYSAMLRNREQFQAIVNSKAYAKLRDLPYVQMALAFYQAQAADSESPVGKFEAARRDPDIKKSLKFLTDLLSDEVFVYGGASFNQTLELVQGTFNDYNSANFMKGFRGGLEGARNGRTSRPQTDEDYGRAFVQALIKRVDLIKCPELVMGFKVKDQAAAKEQLDRLESNLRTALAQAPKNWQNSLKRATVGGHSYLTLAMDGSMIDWDPQVLEKIRSLAATRQDGDKLIGRLKKTTLVISLGIRDDYLLLAIGPSTDILDNLGNGAALSSLPELAAVAKFADKRIYSVGYLSKSLHQHFGYTTSSVDNALKLGKSLLPTLPVPENLREEIAKDADDMAADIKGMITELGAMTSVAFLTDSGMENYDYDWSEHPEIDSSKPLDLLKHIGGNPVGLMLGRSKFSPESYEILVKWIGIGNKYLQQYGVPQMKPDERAQFEKIFRQVKPLAIRVDKTTRDLLIPALADGQSGLVLDAKFTSQQFIKSAPRTEQALTMIEPALVVGVSDAAKLKQAFAEYYDVADDFVEVLKGIEKSEVPKDFKIPRPKMFRLRLGTAYGYRLPAEWGIDSRVMPNAGLSAKVAVLSLSGQHTIRLLTETEPKIAGLPLSTDRPLASVSGWDFAAFIDALTPWIDFGLDKAAPQMQPEMVDMVRQHIKAVLDVLKVYRGSVAETYIEDKVTVTHSRAEYHDIAE